jgi:hypothetical protein
MEKEAVTDATQHMAHKAERTKQWMSREGLEEERKWMTDTESVLGKSPLSPFCRDTRYGRDLREQVIQGNPNAAGESVPKAFLPVLVEAMMKPGLAEDTGLAAVNAPHSRTQFRAKVRAMSNGSAPGGSGLSYAELKCMNDNMLDLLSDLCNVSVAAGLPPSEWCTEIVYMIPKETGVDAIEKQRPLKLQEALKKVTVGIRKDRMANAWERLGVCDASQYAFLQGRSTIQPAMIKRLLLERAKHHGLPMVAAELDWMKAYDSVDRWVKEMVLRRLGLQYDFIDFLLSFDRRNEQRVRTYYGDSEPFACERGTCPQGGVESCFVFLAVMDWMLAVVKSSSHEPVEYPVNAEESVEVSETVFADDASLYQRSLASMQAVVDACMLFCGLTGMHCNIGKCRWMATAGTDVGEGILSGVQWLSHGRWGVIAGNRERFEKVDLDEVWRYCIWE